MPKLYSYCIPVDDGAAPNPFGNICTLTICKPVIRRSALVGDWIVATGSMQYGFENKVIYAMEVTQKLTMQEYDTYCWSELPQKIPNWRGHSYKERVGDCIYDFSTETASIRKGVHNEGNRQRDLGGMYALLSNHFYYFGDKPLSLPDHLLPIVRQGQGHKSNLNAPYYHDFIAWILKQSHAKNKVYGEPHLRHLFTLDSDYESKCAVKHIEMDDADEAIGESDC